MIGSIHFIPNDMESDWWISKEYSQRGLRRTAAFIYEEGTYRLGLCVCQVLWILLIMRQPQLRQNDCRPDRKWMEIMTGQPDACLPSMRAHILAMPVRLLRSSAWQKKKKDRFLLWQLSLIAILVHAAGSRTTEAAELIDGKVAASLDRPLAGDVCSRTSVL